MILQVDNEIYELILQTLMECGYDDIIEDIVIYQECEHDKEDEPQPPKLQKKKKNKKSAD
tara:strand:+ start:366 stop:545 length:180 start_codon:yes stop_codon:yes gene_type:complete